MYHSYFGHYLTAAERKAKLQKKIDKFNKKNKNLTPIILEDGILAKNWWGKAWNKNLESYADYSNRINRGKSYIKNGAILDFELQKNIVKALVQGSTSSPYAVQITIQPLNKKTWKDIVSECQGKIDELDELLLGKFPKNLSEVFTKQNKGLFPSPKEISFYCSCPDSAYMCKHVASVLYGIGAKLDKNPAIFFELRDVNISELISDVIQSKTGELIKKAANKTKRVLGDDKIAELFGIEIEIKVKPKIKKTTKSNEK